MEVIDVMVQTMGLGPTGTVIVTIVLAMIRAGAATASANISDEKLGRFEKLVNIAGANTGQAANK